MTKIFPPDNNLIYKIPISWKEVKRMFYPYYPYPYYPYYPYPYYGGYGGLGFPFLTGFLLGSFFF